MLHEMKYWFALLCKGWIYIKTHFLHCKTNPQTKIQINFLEGFFFFLEIEKKALQLLYSSSAGAMS